MTDLKLDTEAIKQRIKDGYTDAVEKLESRFEELMRDTEGTLSALKSYEMEERIDNLVMKADAAVVFDVNAQHVHQISDVQVNFQGLQFHQRMQPIGAGRFRALVMLFRVDEAEIVPEKETRL